MVKLIKNYWIPSEEEELKRALASTTNNLTAQLGHEPSTKDSMAEGRSYPGHFLLVYFRLMRDGLECFDGDGNIYGFNGETVIRKIIECYGAFGRPLKEYVDNMQRLLDRYVDKFHFYT